VTVGTAVDGGETVNLRVRVHYVSNGSSYTSAWITDLSGETLRKGGFDVIADSSPAAGYMNPGDADVVQITVFSDVDANGKPVEWTGAVDFAIVRVKNLGTATPTNDIAAVRVTLTIGADNFVWDGSLADDWETWAPGDDGMGFRYDQFKSGAATPGDIPDNGVLTVKVEMRIAAAGTVTDGRTIRTETLVRVEEQGQDSGDPAIRYDQRSTSAATQVIRKQGYEAITDESASLGSGTAATGNVIVQTVRAVDSDRNALNVQAYRIYIRNTGTAEGTEINKIELKAGGTTLLSIDNTIAGHGNLPNFRTGAWYPFTPYPAAFPPNNDNLQQVYKIYYTIGLPVDGHTLKPAVRIGVTEQPGGTSYDSDEVVYPDTLSLYLPGFEFVENQTPPEGGVAYSGQRLLAQTIRVEDLDEDDDNVAIHPVVVKNIGTATGNPDVTKVEVWRRNTPTATAVKLGETTDLTGFRTGGARVELTHDNVVTDAAGGAEAYLDIYLTISEPEVMVAGRTIQLETRVLHTENLQSFDKMVVSNQWTLETNHRPAVTITVAVAAVAAAAAKADFTYDQTIQFTGAATDADGDAITAWHWDFGDGTTSDIQNPTHQYPNGGTFTVTLTVTDARGITGTGTKTITVEGPPNVPPTVDFTWTPTAPASGQDVTFTATITDTDQPAGTPHTYAWDFGDLGTSTAASPTHAFAANQSYTVTLTVTDAEAGTGTATHTVSVGNAAPVVTTLTASPTAAVTGQIVTFTAAATDEDEEDTIASFTFNFGDGTDEVVTTVAALSAKASGTVQQTHTYAAAGTYEVSVTATDSRGAVSAAKTLDITVTGPTQVIVTAFPNPASTQATFNYYMPDVATDPILRVYRLDGKVVFEVELNEGASTYTWNLVGDDGEDLANGLYFCVVTATDADGKTVRSEVFRLLITQ